MFKYSMVAILKKSKMAAGSGPTEVHCRYLLTRLTQKPRQTNLRLFKFCWCCVHV